MVCTSAFCLEVWEQLYLNAFSQELKNHINKSRTKTVKSLSTF